VAADKGGKEIADKLIDVFFTQLLTNIYNFCQELLNDIASAK
jgi:hypothetical protein